MNSSGCTVWGRGLFDDLVGKQGSGLSVRIYAPVGLHEDLLAYLVRRLLENGANTSFVNRIVDEGAPVGEIVADPVVRMREIEEKPHPKIPRPLDLYGKARRNSRGIDLSDPVHLQSLKRELEAAAAKEWAAEPTVAAGVESTAVCDINNPADRGQLVGRVVEASASDVTAAVDAAGRAQADWGALSGAARADCLERAADLYEAQMAAFMAMAIREAGKTVPDAVAEVREAVDFLALLRNAGA